MQSTLQDSFLAQDLAGKAILFEIGAQAGILDCIEDNQEVSITELSQRLGIEKEFLAFYFSTLHNLGLVSEKKSPSINESFYFKSPNYENEKNKIGYISWGMMSCAPLIENTKAFTKDFLSAVNTHHRSGEHVARTSKWMGFKDFYPHAMNAILKLNPKKVVDLGSGTCGLLINLSEKIKDFKGIGVDLSKEACKIAEAHIKELGLDDAIKVIVSPIQALIKNSDVFLNADIIHAGFVFHDLLPEEEETLDQLLACICKVAPKAALVISDAVPFSQNTHEQAFSSAFSFLHKFFMGRKLLSETEWETKLKKAGFTHVEITPLGISGGRLFVAKNS